MNRKRIENISNYLKSTRQSRVLAFCLSEVGVLTNPH